ncbi:MAG TPA: TolC family protein, partial [Vicinamibacterales bacterium]|nr:TolC family protein [Vicinamibacterales bacterium]
MLTLIVFALGPLVARAGATGSQATANAREAEQIVHAFERRRQEGPPLTLRQALDEALQRHPELVALRRQVEAAHQRPAQERALASPTLEAQIWAWPIDTLNPAKAQMYMVTVGQDIPGAGKRRLRAALAEKDIELAETETAARAREIAGEVKRSYAELFLVRHAIDLHLAGLDLLRQLADLSSARYAAGSASQQDVLQAVVEISRLHGDLVTLDEREQLAAARLNLLRDRPPEAPIGPLEAPRERTALPAPDTLQRLALERQPRVRAARLAVERAEAALALTRR